MTRRFSVLNASNARAFVVLLAAAAAVLVCASSAAALTFTPGDPVVFRVGTTSETLTSGSASPVLFDEFEPNGILAGSVALPTTRSGESRRLTADGSASSEGLLSLSGNDEFLFAVGYNSPLGTKKVAELKASGTVKEEEEGKAAARVVGRVSKTGEVNTETALSDFGNGNNARSATSQEGTKIWVGGAGKGTSGGVHYTELKKTTSTVLNNVDVNVRQVEVVNGQLYTSADPTKNGLTVAKVGTGLPISGEMNTVTNLPFETETAPKQPYSFSLVTLGLGSEPDTAYVADGTTKENAGRNSIVKYCLKAGKWVEEGAVELPFITGIAARDTNGVVTIYATSAGEKGLEGHLYKLTDVSGFGGTLAGVLQELYSTPANEAFRGVAFAPGTTFETGGTPPPAPTIKVEKSLASAIGDPTNPTSTITIGDPAYSASELTVLVHSANQTVAPQANINVTGSGKERILHVTPAAVGESKLTVTVEAPDGATQSALVQYGASAEQPGNNGDRYYDGAGNASTAIDVGGGYMVVGDDENNILRLYHSRHSSEPVKTYDFTSVLPHGATEMDIEASARAGNTLYWLGSMSNSHHGELRPQTDVLFAATITGSGASTELTYLGSYTHLREDLEEWDSANGKPLGLAESAAAEKGSDLPNGFNVEGVEFAAGSEEEAYVGFRAPIEPTSNRTKALVVPVTNFGDLVKHGNPGLTKASFGSAMEWNLSEPNCVELKACLGIREIRKNAEGEYLIIAGQSEESNIYYALYGWDGEPEDEPVRLETPVPGLTAEGAWESIVSVPNPITNNSEVELLEDDGDTTWYESGLTSKNGLAEGLQKDLGRLFTIHIPAPGPSAAPELKSGSKTPNAGEFTIHWKPAPTLRARFQLQHENAEGGWTTVASNLSKREFTFKPENEGTWKYRVKESNETAEAAFSGPSGEIKVDRTPPETPTPSAPAPTYAGKGGWYKDTVTVSFISNGDPKLADKSSPSGVKPGSLTSPMTFNTSGSHPACGTEEDNVGNLSAKGCLTVQVDATPPTLEIECPTTAVQGESVHATVSAKDEESGLASDPSGNVPINTSTTGPQTTSRTAVDNVGHETTKSCTTEVVYPTPGAPALTGANPNNGQFKLTWTGANPGSNLGLTYTLQHRPIASGTWTTVASGIEALSYEFPKSAKEAEGTWLYRVQGVDSVNLKQTAFSPESVAVVVGLPPELGHCVPAPTKEGKNKPEGTGAFAKSACSALSKKHNGGFNWEGGVQKGKFSSGEAKNLTLIAANKTKVECRGAQVVTGEFVTSRRAENVSLKLSECESSLFGKCTSTGSLEGKIVSKTLEGLFGVYKAGSKPAADKAGLDLFPAHHSGPFAEYSCGGRSFSIRGSVIFAARANKITPGIELSAKASKGKQKPAEGFVEEPKAQLEVAEGAGPYEAVGLTDSLRLETEEPLELNTVA